MALAETVDMSKFPSMFLNHYWLARHALMVITEKQKKTLKHNKNFLKHLHAAHLLTFHWPEQVTWPKPEFKGIGKQTQLLW